MRVPKRASVVAIGAAVALAAAGCSSSGNNNTGTTGGNLDGSITIDGSQPENPLVPSDQSETGGGDVTDALFTGLVEYNADSAKPENAMAESIDTTDSKVYTIKVKKGWKFHDGTEVKAKNFVDAWNWGAYSPHGAENSSFFAQIQGFADVQGEDPDGDGPKTAPKPKSTTMSGLKVIDDYTFEVTLSEPFSVFPSVIGYTAFSPLPDSFPYASEDPKASEDWGRKPIGNGPFKFVSWDNDQAIKVTRFDDYQGDKPKVKDVTWKMYADLDTEYLDAQAGNLDFMKQVPTSALVGGKYKADFPNGNIERSQGAIQTFTFPLYVKRFDNLKFRQAVSMAINRAEITDKIFNKGREPATGFVSPAVDGYKAGVCAEWCTYDAAKAKQLFTESGFTGDFTLAYNTDGGHKAWVEATCNSINSALGATVCKPKAYATFALMRADANAFKMTGALRTGWVMDYPHIQNFLEPIYRTNASSNDGKYSSKEFDDLIAQANAAKPDAAVPLYQQAEAVLVQDLPAIPLWQYKTQAIFNADKVQNVKVTPFGRLDLKTIQAKSK
jgi:oligopeptide transport system substrate-binding protein